MKAINVENNTICTAGDHNYLWGLFLLIASMRAAGMDESVIVGTKGFSDRDRRVLEQFGGVAFLSLDHADHSLTCHKAEVMLAADSDYVTWADSDALFTGNCSTLLAPPDAAQIHVRRRDVAEMGLAFPPPYDLARILPTWRVDVASAAGIDVAAIPEVTAADVAAFRSCSACFLSVARSQERFLRVWHELMMRLPKGDVGVVDRSLACYHQLDESCLNAALAFLPDAPRVTETYALDKDSSRLFAHFVGSPKPWVAWTPSAFRFFDETVRIVAWAEQEGLTLPGPVPLSLKATNKGLCRLLARPLELQTKIQRRVARLLKGGRT